VGGFSLFFVIFYIVLEEHCVGGKMRTNVIMVLAFLALAGSSLAEDYIISNSAHGIDVIDAIVYANAVDKPYGFLNSPVGSARMTLTVGSGREVLLIQSRDNAYTKTLASELEAKGNEVEILESSDPLATNLLLAKRSGARRFIIIDTSYGYNALSVMPYAAITDAFVIMADKNNAQDVAEFLEGADPLSVIQYGYLDDEVKEAIGDYITETIDTGDKYLDNLEIVKRYRAKRNTKQVVMADGSMLEFGIAKGEDPIVLIAPIIPDSVYNYILNSDISTIILVGGDLVPAVDNMRQRLLNDGKEVSVFVKFGKATPGLDKGITALDIFPLPSYPLDLEIKSVTYNEAEKVLEIVYTNKVDAVAYAQADIFIEVNGQMVKTLGDTAPVMIPKGAEKGVQYSLNLDELNIEEDSEIYARVLARYGSTPTSLEKVAATYALLAMISVEDTSELDATRLYYDQSAKQLTLTIKNIGPVVVYYLPSFELMTEEGPKEFSRETVLSLDAGKSKDVIFSGVELSESDIKQNDEVDVHVDYGSREEFLTKSLDKRLKLEVEVKEQPADYTMLIAVLIVIIALLLLLILKKNKRR